MKIVDDVEKKKQKVISQVADITGVSKTMIQLDIEQESQV